VGAFVDNEGPKAEELNKDKEVGILPELYFALPL
jgi:hypothetical protein